MRTADLAEVCRDELVSMIVGGAPPSRVTPPVGSGAHGKRALEVQGVMLSPDRPRVPRVVVRAGEILGLAGLRGSGRELLGRGLAGIERLDIQRLAVEGSHALTSRHATRWLQHHVGFASSRREQEGLAMTLTLRENLFINPAALCRRPWALTFPRRERSQARVIAEELQIKPRDPGAVSGTLSGGNQQKVILGRLLATDAPVLVLEEPTMGIDVGARAEIYRVVASAAASGRAVWPSPATSRSCRRSATACWSSTVAC